MDHGAAWASYSSYTKDITELTRKLGFAGVAVVWVLQAPDRWLSDTLYYALAFIVAFFVADVLQQLIAALLLRGWLHGEERKRFVQTGSIAGDYAKPRWLDYPAFWLLLTKVLLLLIAFALIGKELWSRWQ